MGKGSAWRKGTNFKAYQEADYWKLRDERLAKEKEEKQKEENEK